MRAELRDIKRDQATINVAEFKHYSEKTKTPKREQAK